MLPVFKINFMEYKFTILKTKEDCDTVISIAKKEKSDLEFRMEALERQSVSSTETAAEIQIELDLLNTELSYLDSIIASLPEGKLKAENFAKWKKADYRKFLLTNRKNSYGVIAAMDKQYDICCIEKQIEETDNYISLVVAHRDGL